MNLDNVTYIHSAVKDLPQEYYELCYRNNFRDRGLMRDALVEARCARDQNWFGPAHVIMLWNGNDFVGWSLLFTYWRRRNSLTAYYWVKAQHRRQGYGTLLYKLSRKHHHKKFRVDPWNDRAGAFFSKVSNGKII